jgi:hypothetical protein
VKYFGVLYIKKRTHHRNELKLMILGLRLRRAKKKASRRIQNIKMKNY